MTSRLPRQVVLPSGDHLTVRQVSASDVDELAALYARLDVDDRYRRFFTNYTPDRQFFERLATPTERGGGAVVAVVGPGSPAGDDMTPVGTIVGEASYFLLDNGNGEVDVTVDRDWRGWLGPYLLAELCELAADRGIGNLEAEILTENRPMRSLTRARGEVIRPGSDWQTARVLFAARGATPSWNPTEHPKVLVEARAARWDAIDALDQAGYDVLLCPGPDARSRGCPLLAEGRCPLADGADAIVVALPDPSDREALLAAHRAAHPDVPVEVLEPGQPWRSDDDLERAVDRALLRDDPGK
jgi:hypothetical protein